MGKVRNQESYLKFNFDVSAYRLLGRELITDRITALFELVKNSYDANSNKVNVEFIDIEILGDSSKIIISDDGLGMELSDIKNKWMVIGTSSKRKDRTSPYPYLRKVSGKKGVGRFAVDKLGAKLLLKTKKRGVNKLICLETDWLNYASIEKAQLKLDFDTDKDFFTDIKNTYWLEDADINSQGTSLEITHLEESWTENDIQRAYKELSKLVSPNSDLTQFPFDILIKSPYKDYIERKVKINLIDFASYEVQLKYDKNSQTQEKLSLENGKLIILNVKEPTFGFVDFKLYYFDREAKRKYKEHFNVDIDGIKIYRDGIITTPFAEHVANQEKQKDILGIDKRRYSGFFERLGSRDLIGFVEITDENNSNIIESTNRQDFVLNKAYEELKLFIIEQIQKLEGYLKFERDLIRKNTKSDLGTANSELKAFKKAVAELIKTAPVEIKDKLKDLENSLGKIQGSVNKSIKDYSKLEEESKQKESLYFSLVSLQTYAAMFSHMTQHTLGHIIRDAEYFSKHFPNEKLNDRFLMISKRIYSEFLTLRSGVEFMLKYAKSDSEIEDINLYELLSNLFDNIYLDIFLNENIKAELKLKNDLILKYNKKALEDIFDNLISNSIKALKGKNNKKIVCHGEIEKDRLVLIFSDNGVGISEDDKYRIFDIFFTKTAENGGAGIGLYMVKTRIESMEGTIEVIENELKPTGATFKINLPFKK